jgi:hypothetical protein
MVAKTTKKDEDAQVGKKNGNRTVKLTAGPQGLQARARIGPLVNQAPVLDSLQSRTAHPGRQLAFYANALDSDGDAVTYSLVNPPNGVAINAGSGRVTWTPGWNQTGAQTITVQAADAGGLTDQKACTVTVANQAPALDPLPDCSAQAGHPLTLHANATDPDGDPITYSLVNPPNGATINAATGLFTWTPSPNQLGASTVTIQAADPGGLTAQVSFSVTVSDPGPAMNALANRAAHPGILVSFFVNASDPDGDALTYTLINPPAGAAIDAQGHFTWTPGWNQLGATTITVRVADPANLTAQGSCTVTVANQAPSLDPLPNRQATVGRQLAFFVNGTDPDGDPLTYSLASPPAGAAIDPQSGRFTFTPTAAGNYPITVQVTDPGGLSATGNFTVTV